MIEILIGEQGNHCTSSDGLHLRATMAQSFTERRRFRPAFNLAPQRFSLRSPLTQVLIYGVLVFQIKGNRPVNAAQRDRGITVLNLLGGRPLVEFVNNQVEPHTCAGKPQHAIPVGIKWRGLGQWNRIHRGTITRQKRVWEALGKTGDVLIESCKVNLADSVTTRTLFDKLQHVGVHKWQSKW